MLMNWIEHKQTKMWLSLHRSTSCNLFWPPSPPPMLCSTSLHAQTCISLTHTTQHNATHTYIPAWCNHVSCGENVLEFDCRVKEKDWFEIARIITACRHTHTLHTHTHIWAFSLISRFGISIYSIHIQFQFRQKFNSNGAFNDSQDYRLSKIP